MSIKTIKHEKIGEEYYQIEHKSGLTIYVYPKEDYSSTYAIFGTKYGSIHTTFENDKNETIKVPDGIAHYLEHKLFEDEDGDAFAKYAKTGASANAYTSFDKTCYLFSCTEKFDECMEILLNFVQSPYFTEESVQKEQGIIGQEIRMYDDSASWRVLFNLLGALYENHPVKIDISGTVETIAEITPEKLYECYNGFYNLHNMALCIAGKVTLEEAIKLADKYLKQAEPFERKIVFPHEPECVTKQYVEQAFSVAVPLFQFGFKENMQQQMLTAKQLAASEILLSILASNSSPLYNELMDKELINGSFGYEHFEGPAYSSVLFGGESRDPKQTAEIIKKAVENLQNNGIGKEDFEIAKKVVYGEIVSALNKTDSIANIMIDFAFSGRELYSYIDEIANTSLEDVEKRLKEQFNCENSALSVIIPKEE